MAEITFRRKSVVGKHSEIARSGSAARSRVVIENVRPSVDFGRFPVKRCVGDLVEVCADIFADGHDLLAAVVRFRHGKDSTWQEAAMQALPNDEWRGSFRVEKIGRYFFSVQGWMDCFRSWQENVKKKVLAGQDPGIELEIGANIIRKAANQAPVEDRNELQQWIDKLTDSQQAVEVRARSGFSEELAKLMFRYPQRGAPAQCKELEVIVDRERAVFSSWYEMFPRSATDNANRHGTFRDCEARLPYVAGMGFDILYLPPIHPIGFAFRKGRNNNLAGEENAVGSPWAIGSSAGGHKSIHSQLGTMEDFERLVAQAKDHGLEIALDIAFQVSPDHPYVKDHPEWFRWRPDGTIQYAENPPKKYQDIYPFAFDCQPGKELWEELKSIFAFWAEKGVRAFRVDNPHTKPFAFWEWAIAELKREYPNLIFLSEAFTRPKIMYQLAKAGFTQSYTYFTWRNSKQELTEYLTELTQTPVREFFRPNFWPNTPDILPEYLQQGGRPAFISRLVLAATLSSNYGIYGPSFELMEHRPLARGKEEYLHSEKYEIRAWDVAHSDSLAPLITRINHARRQNPALQRNDNLRFHPIENEQLLAYSKLSADHSNLVLVVVNLDYRWKQSGFIHLPLWELGLNADKPYQLHDLLTGNSYLWQGSRNYVELRPAEVNAHLFRIEQQGVI